MSPRRLPRPHALSLRLKVVLITAVAVTAMVGVGGYLIIYAVHEEFLDAADWTANQRAQEVAELAAEDRLPERLPMENEGETAVQVVRGGQVISSTRNLRRQPPLFGIISETRDGRVVDVPELPGFNNTPFRATSTVVETAEGRATVVVAISIEDIEDVIAVAFRTGALGLVLLVLPLSFLLWIAVGRTLAPVDAIRERAEHINGERLSERVPEPVRADEIGRLSRTINGMLSRLDASAAEQRRFLADAAHELRSPVASLRAQLETSHLDLGLEETEVADLLSDTLRMQALVDQLLLLARSDAGTIAARRIAVDLDDTVGTVVSGLRVEGRRPDVAVDAAGLSAVQVVGDPALLEQVVRNLVENAVRHARTTVRVGLAADGEAVLVVDDDGPGIPPPDRDRVFDRFTRLDTARNREDGGVGLGLAIVADVVHAHGGQVRVTDSPLGGARFEVTLPLSDVMGLVEEPVDGPAVV